MLLRGKARLQTRYLLKVSWFSKKIIVLRIGKTFTRMSASLHISCGTSCELLDLVPLWNDDGDTMSQVVVRMEWHTYGRTQESAGHLQREQWTNVSWNGKEHREISQGGKTWLTSQTYSVVDLVLQSTDWVPKGWFLCVDLSACTCCSINLFLYLVIHSSDILGGAYFMFPFLRLMMQRGKKPLLSRNYFLVGGSGWDWCTNKVKLHTENQRIQARERESLMEGRGNEERERKGWIQKI